MLAGLLLFVGQLSRDLGGGRHRAIDGSASLTPKLRETPDAHQVARPRCRPS
jgi:hypothetical protein